MDSFDLSKFFSSSFRQYYKIFRLHEDRAARLHFLNPFLQLTDVERAELLQPIAPDNSSCAASKTEKVESPEQQKAGTAVEGDNGCPEEKVDEGKYGDGGGERNSSDQNAGEFMKLPVSTSTSTTSSSIATSSSSNPSISSSFLTLASSSPCDREDVLVCLSACFRLIGQEVERLHLLPNSQSTEELEDVSTGNLKYFTIPFILAELCVESVDLSVRLYRLRQAKIYFSTFMVLMEQFNICRREDLESWKLWQKTEEERQEEEEEEEGRRSARWNTRRSASAVDPGKARQQNIERVKYQKTLDAAIAKFMCQRRSNCNDRTEDEYSLGHDEETERQWILAILRRFSSEVPSQLRLIEEELPLLQRRLEENLSSEAKEVSGRNAQQRSPTKPWTVMISRDPLKMRDMYRQQVFVPPHNLPTMTLAECADYEMSMAAKPSSQLSTVKDYDEAEHSLKEQAEEVKAREWDDWKDENPKGSGNKMKNVG